MMRTRTAILLVVLVGVALFYFHRPEIPKHGRSARIPLPTLQISHTAFAYGFLCYATNLREVDSVNGLPDGLQFYLDDVADQGQPFNATDVIQFGRPMSRFDIAAVGENIALIQVENGGDAYNMELGIVLKRGESWIWVDNLNFGYGQKPSLNLILEDARRQFSCPSLHYDDAPVAPGQLVATLTRQADNGEGLAQFRLGYLHAHGIELPLDYGKAIHYLRLALSSANPTIQALAYEELARVYADEHNAQFNKVVAYSLREMMPGEFKELDWSKTPFNVALNQDELKSAESLMQNMVQELRDKGTVTKSLDDFFAQSRNNSRLRLPP